MYKRQLLVRAREGDERAFDQLYRATADIQWKQAYAMLRAAGLAVQPGRLAVQVEVANTCLLYTSRCV